MFQRGSEIAASLHHGDELGPVAGDDRVPELLDRIAQRLQRLASVLVQALDLEIQIGILRSHACGHVDLRVVCRAGELRETRSRLTAAGQRGEECDVERVGQTQHVRDQPVVLVERHDHLLRHRGGEQ